MTGGLIPDVDRQPVGEDPKIGSEEERIKEETDA
jgi:hypothetical protein